MRAQRFKRLNRFGGNALKIFFQIFNFSIVFEKNLIKIIKICSTIIKICSNFAPGIKNEQEAFLTRVPENKVSILKRPTTIMSTLKVDEKFPKEKFRVLRDLNHLESHKFDTDKFEFSIIENPEIYFSISKFDFFSTKISILYYLGPRG